LHPAEIKPDYTKELLQNLVQATSQGGKYVRKAKRLATHRNQIRPLCTYFHVGNLHRSNRHLLDQSMSPDPRPYQV